MTEGVPSQRGLSQSAAIIIGSVIIGLAILLAGDVIKFKNSPLNAQAVPNVGGGPSVLASGAPAAVPEVPSGPVSVSIDDDPLLGDKNAPVTIVEFSDYECPFCKRHFDQTYPQLKKDFIDTGKVKLVFRDYPLPFHEPMASVEANAANCAREQGGDAKYYELHDMMFTQTTSNGTGLTKDKVYAFGAQIGLNAANFKICVDTDKFKDEIAKDVADATKADPQTGTPTFYIGKSTANGVIEGYKIVGAQPYAAFQTQINSLLQ